MNRPDSTPPRQSARATGSLKRQRLRESSLRRKALGVAAFLILAASALNALFGERGVLGLMKARQEYSTLAAQVNELEAENRRLSEEITALRSDPFVVERIAREVFGMAMPDEISVTIRYPEPN
jgi:cell division protein FtsB